MAEVAPVGVLRAQRLGPVWRPSSVKRCLFGPADPKETEEFLERMSADILDANCRRWNFDFAAEKPLECGGRFEWSPIQEPAPAEKKQRQTVLTDFMRKRKSSSHQSKDEDPPQGGPKKRRRAST